MEVGGFFGFMYHRKKKAQGPDQTRPDQTNEDGSETATGWTEAWMQQLSLMWSWGNQGQRAVARATNKQRGCFWLEETRHWGSTRLVWGGGWLLVLFCPATDAACLTLCWLSTKLWWCLLSTYPGDGRPTMVGVVAGGGGRGAAGLGGVARGGCLLSTILLARC
jgi:hypothetical protein